MSRGYFGIGIYQPKNSVNIGTLWRTANILGASFMFTIGRRYKHQCSDVLKTPKHIPLYNYETFEEFKNHLPHDCVITAVEMGEGATEVSEFSHPERTVYMLGAEDYGIPEAVLKKCHRLVKLKGERSMNVSVAGSIVLYDRVSRAKKQLEAK